MATKSEELQGKIEQLSTDIGLVNGFTHGTETQTVTLGGKETPSLRKLVADIDARESAAAKDVVDAAKAGITAEGTAQVGLVNTAGNSQTTRVTAEGDTQVLRVRDVGDAQSHHLKTVAADEIERTEQAADRAENAARSIPGFAANVRSFFGLRVNERMHLTVVRSEDGDLLRGADYDHWYVLPHEARFFIDNGRLMLELPFQAQP